MIISSPDGSRACKCDVYVASLEVFFRYMVIGLYVGIATVGIFIYWYCFDVSPDGHSLVTVTQLMTWGSCKQWDFSPRPCLGLRRPVFRAQRLYLSLF